MNLTDAQKTAELAKLVEKAKEGHDPVALAERAGVLRIPRETAIRKLAKFHNPDETALAALLGKKGARRDAAKGLFRGYDRGARIALDQDRPLSAAQRLSAVNDQAERLAILDDARDANAARKAAASGVTPDAYADGATIVARIMADGGAQTRQPDAGGVRSDGARLGYRGKTHSIVGPSEAGKTLLMVAMACDEMRAGGSVLHLDTDDNSEDDTFALYLAFGVDPDVLADASRFRYSAVRSVEGARRFVADAAEWRPDFVILDAVAPFLALFGFDPNSNAEYRTWHAEVPAKLSALGASVWQIDHTNRDEATATRHASGAAQKLASISGVQYGVALVEPFVPGVGGASSLKIFKDRPGGVRAISPAEKTPTAALFRLDSRGGGSTWEFWRGRDSSERLEEQAAADVAYVLSLDPFPESRAKLQAALRASQGKGWRDDRARIALDAARSRRDASTTFPIDQTVTKG